MDKHFESRKNMFAAVGVPAERYQQLDVELMNLIYVADDVASLGVSADETFSVANLKEMFAAARDFWQEKVLTPSQKPQSEIDYKLMYGVDLYLVVLYECWYNWTCKSTAKIISFVKKHPELDLPTIFLADGVSAAAITYALAFPGTKVMSHIMGEKQLKLAQDLKSSLGGLENLEIVSEIKSFDFEHNTVALECFEHFYAPQRFLDAAWANNCKMIAYSAPWKVKAHGHFDSYWMDNLGEISNRDMPRAFGKWLRELGFESSVKKYNFRFFNGDPSMDFKK